MLFRKRNRMVKRIMIVEDEPLVAFDHELMLADAGYEILGPLDNHADAVALLGQESVDLILCDIALSGEKTGLDLARDAAPLGVSVLFVTGNPPADAHELAIGVLRKPHNGRMLKAALAAVDVALSGKKPGRLAGLELYGMPVRAV